MIYHLSAYQIIFLFERELPENLYPALFTRFSLRQINCGLFCLYENTAATLPFLCLPVFTAKNGFVNNPGYGTVKYYHFHLIFISKNYMIINLWHKDCLVE
jgi:hypothetical protein